MIMIRKYLFLFLSILNLTTCNRNGDSTSLNNQEKLIQVYITLTKLQERLPVQDPAFLDSSRAILEHYHFTEEEYNQSLSYFNEKPERWQTFYQEVLKQLEDE